MHSNFRCGLLQTFQVSFNKKDGAMVNNNYIALNKTTLIGWVDKALNQSFMKKNITLGFKVTRISRLNPRAMDEKKKTLAICT
jgi:hypothetical protein